MNSKRSILIPPFYHTPPTPVFESGMKKACTPKCARLRFCPLGLGVPRHLDVEPARDSNGRVAALERAVGVHPEGVVEVACAGRRRSDRLDPEVAGLGGIPERDERLEFVAHTTFLSGAMLRSASVYIITDILNIDNSLKNSTL